MDINELIKNAMLSKDIEHLNVLKLIKAEFIKKQTEPNRKTRDLSEEEQYKVLLKMAAQRKDSIDQYLKGGRKDLAEAESKELDYINTFLPKEPSQEEIVEYLKSVVSELKSKNTELSMKNLKEVMSVVKAKYPTADGGLISKTYKEII